MYSQSFQSNRRSGVLESGGKKVAVVRLQDCRCSSPDDRGGMSDRESDGLISRIYFTGVTGGCSRLLSGVFA